MALLQIRVDDDLKLKAAVICDALGIDLSTAIRIFLKKITIEGGIPFEIKLDEATIKGMKAIDEMRTLSEQNGNSEMTLDEINEEIRLARKERTKMKKSK